MIEEVEELWRPFPEFPFIEANMCGEIHTLDRLVSDGIGGKRLVKGRTLKQHPDKYGYLHISFSVNGKVVSRLAHRIVAGAFILNPNSLPEINHKNCIRDDNRFENLEWCDSSYNQKYREKHGVSMAESQGYPLLAINLTTLEVSWFRSQGEAGRILGVINGKVNMVIKGKRNKTGGYWFVNDDDNAIIDAKDRLYKLVGDKINDLRASDDSKEVIEFIVGLQEM